MKIDAMSHEQALSSQAVERYALGELTQDEREAFEGHYFDCSACFDQVRMSAQFLRHAHEVLEAEPEKGWLGRMLGDLWRPAPAFACAMLVCAIAMGGYQQSVIAGLQAPEVEKRYTLTGEAKGGPRKLVQVSRKQGLGLTVEFVRKAEFSAYQAQLLTGSGKVKASLPVPDASEGDSITVTLRADALQSGAYSLVVYGLTSDGVKTVAGQGNFDLQVAN